MLLDSLFTCNSNKSGCTEFYQWEKPVQSLLYQCFTRVHPQKNENTHPSDVYEKLNEIDNLIKSQHSNTNLQKEKEEILNKICILEKKKASEFYHALKNLDLNGKLNPDSFYKIKIINKKTS